VGRALGGALGGGVSVSTFRVVDAHVHFWDPAALDYPWLVELPSLRRAFHPHDYTAFADGSVDAAVFVEANCAPRQSAGEVELVERWSEEEPRIAGIVAFVDLLDDARRPAALERARRSPRVVGVRHNIQHQAAGFALQDAFVHGVRDVGALDLPFDLCITADQLVEVTQLVERCPETRFVLDHCGKPAIRDDAYGAWARDLERLARHEHVVCKLSGLLTEARADQRDAESLRPYLEHARACFGAARLLYGSDWPVSTLAGGERRWREIVDDVSAAWPEAERRALFADTATRIYGLRAVVHG
jgi:L-fuconolactonase